MLGVNAGYSVEKYVQKQGIKYKIILNNLKNIFKMFNISYFFVFINIHSN